MADGFLDHVGAVLAGIEAEGLMKREREITSPQGAWVTVAQPGEPGRRMLNLCANNYLGLADDPRLIAAATQATASHGYGMASVRFICGTTDLHRALERRLAAWLGHDDAILFAACFDANGAVFEPLLGEEDAVISDGLNHASIIDGIRLCKARRFRFANGDMADLQAQLQAARAGGARFIMVATDGVFSMDGTFADLGAVRALCDQYGALMMVDDCHATGFIGPKGKGTPAQAGVSADILTGTFGKALGGALGGYVAGAQPVIDLLRQRARPYLFSNALPPAVVGAALAAIDIAEVASDLRARLAENAAHWRAGLEALGFTLLPGHHPIVPVMLGDAPLAQAFARALGEEGILVSAFFFPVVPRGRARIRTQMNAALRREDLDFALAAFGRVGKALGVI
ncbi:glycine C-acetyltransferase [Rhodobacter sp. KR11]|uniref:glycine C-acetyltransferase n=1 Tax=Rhodobacter sp. KR11 TaxID=2974588 RepID=UPI0022222907|nr:glycine C-acetyltransferase [Rhodobacter sp. KR11]MCW1920262.1 glycine C-acetyltransferase [Rhodobacter sp. KR11]